PIVPASKARPDRSIHRVVAERGWIELAQLRRLIGDDDQPTPIGADPGGNGDDGLRLVGRWVVPSDVLDAAIEALRADIEAAGALGLDIATLDEQRRAVLERIDEAKVDAGRVVLGTPVDPLADHWWVEVLLQDPLSPPNADGVDRAEVRELVRRGLVIEHDGVYFAATALEVAGRRLRSALEAQPEGMTVAEIRDLWGTSRKYVLAILGWMDATGQTRRREDLRLAGPRLPQ
ncbi:MAG: SelB C-terminal domain-containing protein, partial [Acidimicrobiales bacterium]